jgi:hypothetical protein
MIALPRKNWAKFSEKAKEMLDMVVILSTMNASFRQKWFAERYACFGKNDARRKGGNILVDFRDNQGAGKAGSICEHSS